MSAVEIKKINSLTGHRDCVYTLQPADEPNLFFSAAGDGMIVQWDLSKPNDEGELVAKLPNSVYALHHHPEKNVLVAGHNYEGIHLLDWLNKKELASLQLTTAAIFDIQSYGNDLIVATGDGMIFVVDMEKWIIRKKLLTSEKSARSIAVNPRKGEVAVGYSDFYIRVFDLDSYSLKYEFKAHNNSIFTLRYSPDHSILLSGGRDARLKVWDAGEEYSPVQEIAAHLYAINHIDFSADGKHFVTCSMDKSIKVWHTGDLKLLKVIDKARHAGHGTSVNKLFWTSYKDQLISAGDDRTISIWNIFFKL